uniref:J domain-containing protein n=1 Tax=Chromera velia CCMP2878 TaxID=1169474 RepID=A0A0G4F883_9ALVE|eukprot:Cvel_2934.t1-p1 / transcript=Cvel_2934.t1 / gene=Cvel_2934 / organism=Chromera_velia_CCMP2878 / gene_product=hypothetical protein / transcript_product=hypothetical protein / location=Cvel_scaffold116:26349-27891(+) / protein_length=179 / sequence_SO=supercontig / SO=protein_coding / is_pseudo=false
MPTELLRSETFVSASILGLSEKGPFPNRQSEIQKAYKGKAFHLYPDKNLGREAEANEEFKKLGAAKDYLQKKANMPIRKTARQPPPQSQSQHQQQQKQQVHQKPRQPTEPPGRPESQAERFARWEREEREAGGFWPYFWVHTCRVMRAAGHRVCEVGGWLGKIVREGGTWVLELFRRSN